MLTHAIQVAEPEQPPIQIGRKLTGAKLLNRMRQRLKQDLKNRRFRKGDSVYIPGNGTGTIIDIITEFDEVTEWDNTKPLNVEVWLYDYDCTFLFNVSDLSLT